MVFPSVSEVSAHFTLNELQTVAFEMIANAFVEKLAAGYKLQQSVKKSTSKSPFVMYMGGEGGDGKNKSYRCIDFFLRRNGFVQVQFALCAPTGIAASLIKGQTFHSMLSLRGGSEFNARRRPSEKAKSDMAAVLVLVVDEVSMLSRRNLGALSVFLQKVKDNEEEDYGGVIMVFSGDFFQIPPVSAFSVYQSPSGFHSKGKLHPLEELGYRLWNSIENVVILKESMRHTDTSFRDCVRRSGKENIYQVTLLV